MSGKKNQENAVIAITEKYLLSLPMSKAGKFFRILGESLKGGERDFTTGSIPRAVVLLAIPMILELSLESVFAIVDMLFVSRLGENAMATVGLTESVITIVYSVAIGLSTAATALVARRTGEKNMEEAAKAGAQALTISLIATVALSLAGFIFAPQILHAMGGSPVVVRDGAIFTRIMLGGSIVIMLLFLINGIFRGAGDAAIAMKSLWLASGINIILCPIFVYFFGLKGAAFATVIGRGTGVLYQCYHLFNGKRLLKFKRAYFKLEKTLARSIISVAWPATFQFIIQSGSWIVLTKLIADTGGTDASAGYQAAIRCVIFFILPAWGLSNAAATLVGQNLGAKQVDRAVKSVFMITKYNVMFMAFVMLLFIFCAEPIIRVFAEKQSVVNYGTTALRVLGSGFLFYGVAMVMTQALNGAGDTRTPTLINFFCFWLF
ncbi:MAG TPA: MATE family efflux transporter, partial [Flavobacteriales bacterium]|nr:MATE family efflux transporter [Flavobacteriales bacterium]